MEVVYERCCGLDVHKKSVVACVITPEGTQDEDLWHDDPSTSAVVELA